MLDSQMGNIQEFLEFVVQMENPNLLVQPSSMPHLSVGNALFSWLTVNGP